MFIGLVGRDGELLPGTAQLLRYAWTRGAWPAVTPLPLSRHKTGFFSGSLAWQALQCESQPGDYRLHIGGQCVRAKGRHWLSFGAFAPYGLLFLGLFILSYASSIILCIMYLRGSISMLRNGFVPMPTHAHGTCPPASICRYLSAYVFSCNALFVFPVCWFLPRRRGRPGNTSRFCG